MIILSGDRGSGKTAACIRLAETLAAREYRIGGIASPSLRDSSGFPVEIAVRDLAGSGERLLAARGKDLGGPFWPPAGQSPATGTGFSFGFSAEAISWAIDRIRAAMNEKADLVIIDEIGPLELVLGQGFKPALDDLRRMRDARTVPVAEARRAPVVLCTVRPSLAERLAACQGGSEVAAIDSGERAASFDRLLSSALAALGAAGTSCGA